MAVVSLNRDPSLPHPHPHPLSSRYVQSWLCRWWRTPCRLSIDRRSTPASRCHGRYGSKRLLCRRRSTIETRYSHIEISDRTWHRHQLGWHGKDLASYILQWTSCCTRRTPRSPHRSTPQSQSQSREDDTNHVRNLQHTRYDRHGERRRDWCWRFCF